MLALWFAGALVTALVMYKCAINAPVVDDE